MYDDVSPAPAMARRRGMGARAIAAIVAAALLAGAALAAWIGWQGGWIDLHRSEQTAAPQAAKSLAAAPAPQINPAAAIDDVSAKIAALEARMADLNREADAASGNATQAEALLVAFAARRTIERGQPLGYLEGQLRLRFGESQPQAVQRVIDAGRNPITIDELSQQLASLSPQLIGQLPDESGWDWFKRQMGELVAIRHDDKPSPTPQRRLDRARMFLAGGRIAAAMSEVEAMPGRASAADWLQRARSYVVTEQALDQLETAAILAPQLPASVQAAPQAAPTPQATPAPAATPPAGATPAAPATATSHT